MKSEDFISRVVLPALYLGTCVHTCVHACTHTNMNTQHPSQLSSDFTPFCPFVHFFVDSETVVRSHLLVFFFNIRRLGFGQGEKAGD